MYVTPNLKSKAEIKRHIKEGKIVTVIANSPFDNVPTDGECFVEGPHHPKPHTWYGTATVKDGKVVAIK